MVKEQDSKQAIDIPALAPIFALIHLLREIENLSLAEEPEVEK